LLTFEDVVHRKAMSVAVLRSRSASRSSGELLLAPDEPPDELLSTSYSISACQAAGTPSRNLPSAPRSTALQQRAVQSGYRHDSWRRRLKR